MMLKRGAILAALLLLSVPVPAETLRELKDMAKAGVTTVQGDCIVEGFWLSDYANPNLDTTSPRHYSADHPTEVRFTAYLEATDASCGVKLRAAGKAVFKDIPRWSYVRMNLKGCKLEWYGQEKLEISGVQDANIVYISARERKDIPRKERYIYELRPEDIYTFVTLKDCEFPLKSGNFLNIYEKYAVKTSVNADASPNGAMNSWARLVTDPFGDRMYLMINSAVTWRMEPSGVPQGAGPVSGVLTSGGLPRYGGNVLGRFQLRPLAREDIEFGDSSAWTELASWDWNDNREAFRTDAGDRTNLSGAKVLADRGSGYIAVEPTGEVVRGKDFNRLRVLPHGSLSVRTRACDWWDWEKDCGKGIVLAFPTAGLSAERLVLAFSFSAGNIKPSTNAGYPVWWEVQVSADGSSWQTLRGRHKLRSLPWWYKNDVNGSNYLLSYEAGLGPTEHLVNLPAALLGREMVYVRIVPAEKTAASFAMEGNDNLALRPNLVTPTVVNFGAIAIYAR